MITSKYEPLVRQLVADGMDFSRDVWTLRHSELSEFRELAKKFGYRGTQLHSLGFSFYILLQKVHAKLSL